MKNSKVSNSTEPATFGNAGLSAVFLFLDDMRLPHDAYKYTQYAPFISKQWTIVRSYDEFVNHIQENGIPAFVSFDHDLGLENDMQLVAQEQRKKPARNELKEKTGYDCAKWLVDYCLDNNCGLPDYYIHSMNPVGKQNIAGLLQSFLNSR